MGAVLNTQVSLINFSAAPKVLSLKAATHISKSIIYYLLHGRTYKENERIARYENYSLVDNFATESSFV